MKHSIWRAAAALLTACCALGASAQQPQDAAAAEMRAAMEASKAVARTGPDDVKLADQAVLHVPEGFVFIPSVQAIRILRAMGNSPAADTLGIVFPEKRGESWFAVARYIKSGHIKDDDAKEWKADEMLDQIKEGTEAGNAERRKRGMAEMQVVGWVEKPTYDAATHRLVWSIESRDKGAKDNSDNGINYNTYLLGREGYVSLNFVTDMSSIESQKPVARQLLAAVEFEKGRTYADFNSSTDHLAEYGLAALVGGVAAKKLGLFALIGAFILKFAKVIGLGAIALGAVVVKVWRNRKNSAT